MAAEITNPSYFRVGKNLSGTAIPVRRFVKAGATQYEVVLPAASTDVCEGVVTESLPDQGQRSIQMDGKAIVECSAAIALHALVMTDNTGRALTATTGNMIRGRAMSATANAGEFVEVELWKGRFVAP